MDKFCLCQEYLFQLHIQDQENDHRMNLWTHWIHCKMGLDQDSINQLAYTNLILSLVFQKSE